MMFNMLNMSHLSEFKYWLNHIGNVSYYQTNIVGMENVTPLYFSGIYGVVAKEIYNTRDNIPRYQFITVFIFDNVHDEMQFILSCERGYRDDIFVRNDYNIEVYKHGPQYSSETNNVIKFKDYVSSMFTKFV